jgi:hypothetical protein
LLLLISIRFVVLMLKILKVFLIFLSAQAFLKYIFEARPPPPSLRKNINDTLQYAVRHILYVPDGICCMCHNLRGF